MDMWRLSRYEMAPFHGLCRTTFIRGNTMALSVVPDGTAALTDLVLPSRPQKGEYLTLGDTAGSERH